jgi:hypothetical protein
LKSNNLNSALIVPTQAVDYYPVWSKDNKLDVNINSRWWEFDLTKVNLVSAQLRDDPIGVLIDVTDVELATSTQTRLSKSIKKPPTKVKAKNGTTFEFKYFDLSTVLLVTKTKERTKVVWKSDAENCYGLQLSPDNKLVSFLCEMNGPIVIRTDLSTANYRIYNEKVVKQEIASTTSGIFGQIKSQLK